MQGLSPQSQPWVYFQDRIQVVGHTPRWCPDQRGHFTHTLGSKVRALSCSYVPKKKSDIYDTHQGDPSPHFA